MNRRRSFWGISLLTLSVLMLELSLTRLFSATMYYHFAFMAVSVSMFGLTLGAFLLLSLAPTTPLWWFTAWFML